jgi:hypothetical protein
MKERFCETVVLWLPGLLRSRFAKNEELSQIEMAASSVFSILRPHYDSPSQSFRPELLSNVSF